jgi:hypothetical protein
VPEWWRWTFSPLLAAFLYGVGLGIGFLTHLRHGTLVAVAVAAGSSGDPLTGAVMLGVFGLARTLPLAVLASRTGGRGVAPAERRLESLGASAVPTAANGLILVALAVAAAGAAPDVPGEPAELATAALAVTFAWAAAAKVIRSAAWCRALSGYGLGSLTRPTAIAVPFAEVAVVVLLIAGAGRAAGALAALLAVSFTAAVLRVRGEAHVPCGCFGGRRQIDYRLLVARNVGLVALATVAMVRPVSLFPRIPTLAGADILPVGLAAAGAALALVLARRLATLGTSSLSSQR